jgi:hypothetical protein
MTIFSRYKYPPFLGSKVQIEIDPKNGQNSISICPYDFGNPYLFVPHLYLAKNKLPKI